MPKKALGRGLEALIPRAVPPAQTGEGNVIDISVDTIDANPNQPRKHFDDGKLQQLSESIREDGLLQPVVVRKRGEKYELVMGERRLQAARLAELPTVPAIVKNVKDVDSLRLALVENIQRENLNAIEVANAYRSLLAAFGLTQADLSRLVGRDRSSVANTLRLLNLPDEVQQMIVEEKLNEGHARALLTLPTQREQVSLAKKIVRENLSVRQVEAAVGIGKKNKKSDGDSKPIKEKPPHIEYLEKALATHLNTRVTIDEKRGGRGKLTIEFYNHDDFERLASLMHLPLPR